MLVPTAETSAVEPDEYWKPDFNKLCKELIDTDNPLVKSATLSDMLINYMNTYSKKSEITYIPDLFRFDRNINGATTVVKLLLGDKLKYSFQNVCQMRKDIT